MNRPRRCVPWVAAIIATLAFAGAAGFAGEDGPTTPDLDRLVEELGSEDSEVAANAAQGLFAAGDEATELFATTKTVPGRDCVVFEH